MCDDKGLGMESDSPQKRNEKFPLDVNLPESVELDKIKIGYPTKYNLLEIELSDSKNQPLQREIYRIYMRGRDESDGGGRRIEMGEQTRN